MKGENIRLARVRQMASNLKRDPRSVFYGDVTVEVQPEDVGDALAKQVAPQDVVESAMVSQEPNEILAVDKVAAYNALSDDERSARTLLPALACWNAMVIISPMLGKVLAKALDYMLTKALNEFPYEGAPFVAQVSGNVATVTINSAALATDGTGIAGRYIAVPFFRFTIAASTLNAAPGAQIKIDVHGHDAQGREINTAAAGYSYTFQRLNNTEAVLGVYIPTIVVATRTLPFLPIAGDKGGSQGSPISPETLTITFTGVTSTDIVTVIVPGYATAELKEIASMYNLPAGMIR